MRRLLTTALLLLLPGLAVGQDYIRFYPGSPSSVLAGGSTSSAAVGGVLYVTAAPVINTLTTEETLMSYSLPANTLNAVGRGIRIKACGTTTANGNNKQTYLYFGGVEVASTTLAGWNNQGWCLEALVYKTGSSTQVFRGESKISTYSGGAITFRAVGPAVTIPAVTDTASILIKTSGYSPDAGGDITASFMSVEMLN